MEEYELMDDDYELIEEELAEYYYPFMNDSIKLTPVEFINYLTEEYDKVRKEHQLLLNKLDDIKQILRN